MIELVRLIALSAVLMLSSCGHMEALPPQQPEVRVEQVKVPVAVPCKLTDEAAAQRPKFVDTNEALAGIPDVEAGSRLLKAALAQYHFWVKTLEAGFAQCAK